MRSWGNRAVLGKATVSDIAVLWGRGHNRSHVITVTSQFDCHACWRLSIEGFRLGGDYLSDRRGIALPFNTHS